MTSLNIFKKAIINTKGTNHKWLIPLAVNPYSPHIYLSILTLTIHSLPLYFISILQTLIFPTFRAYLLYQISLFSHRFERKISNPPLQVEGTEKHTIFILILIKREKSIRVFMILVDFLLGEI